MPRALAASWLARGGGTAQLCGRWPGPSASWPSAPAAAGPSPRQAGEGGGSTGAGASWPTAAGFVLGAAGALCPRERRRLAALRAAGPAAEGGGAGAAAGGGPGEKEGGSASLDLGQQVLDALRRVKDEGLGTDIVTVGFVAADSIRVDLESGTVTFKLEVGIFEGRAREEVSKLPWVRRVDIEVAGAAPKTAPPPAPPLPPRPPAPTVPPSLDKVKNIIAVYSCKGGVGKSTVAVNLAFALRQTGASVGIFDCDVYGPSLPLMVKFPEVPQMEMYEDEEKQKHIVPVTHDESGIKLVSFGYAGKAAVMRGSMVTGLIAQLLNQTDWNELDYLVLDMPPGTGDIHLTLAQVCKITAAVIVTTPQKLSVIDVERGITMFSRLEVPSVAVVQNMSYLEMPDGQRAYPFGRTFAGRTIAETFGIDHVFELPMDPQVSAAGDGGVPFVGQLQAEPEAACAAAHEVKRLTDAVVAEVGKINAGARRPEVAYDAEADVLRVRLPDGEVFGIDPVQLRERNLGAGGARAPEPGSAVQEVRDMGNYAVIIRWTDGFVQVAPHRQLINGDAKGPLPRVALEDAASATVGGQKVIL